MSTKLDRMSLPELREMQKDVDGAIARAEQGAIAEAKKRMREIAAEMGVEFADVVTASKAAAKRRTTKAKNSYPPPKAWYKNPDDPAAKLWSGRGKKPRWLTQKLTTGRAKLEDFQVQT
jgi:DNA-binding protein H-NS